jgi:hypothetical protein
MLKNGILVFGRRIKLYIKLTKFARLIGRTEIMNGIMRNFFRGVLGITNLS